MFSLYITFDDNHFSIVIILFAVIKYYIENVFVIDSITVVPFISSAEVSWTPVTSTTDTSGYILQYYPVSFPSHTVSINTPSTSLLVEGLIPTLNYFFQVQVVTDSNRQTWTTTDVHLEENIRKITTKKIITVQEFDSYYSNPPLERPPLNPQNQSSKRGACLSRGGLL